MTLLRRRHVVILFALLAGISVQATVVIAQVDGVANTSAQAGAEPPGPALGAALRKGGFILYFRHTSTDFGESDERMTQFSDCATQRNLTDTGRSEARTIGSAIAALAIPIGDVLASPYCRTMETARLMFGHAMATPAVRGGPAQQDTPARYADLVKLLALPVSVGTNRVIVSHGNPYSAVVGGPYLAEGEAAVIAPRGADGFVVVTRVRKDEWKNLAAP